MRSSEPVCQPCCHSSVIDLVIFDNDGVLVDSEPIACSVLADLLTELGLQTTYEDVLEEYLGGSIGRSRSLAESKLGRELPAFFEQAFHDRLFDRLEHELRPVKDVVWAIERIALPRCVASSGTPERVRKSLQLTGLSEFFGDSIFSATQVSKGKPAPDLFLLAADAMGASPDQCVVVEDSPLGIEGAKAAGMRSVGFAAVTPRHRLADANAGVIGSMRELPDLLNRLASG